MKQLWAHLKQLWARLFSLKDSPHSIAGGVAIGILVGFTPLWGVKTLLALGMAYGLRCNAIAAVIVVSLHDVLIPFAPFMMRMEYDLGFWIMSHPHHLPPKLEMSHTHIHLAEMVQWTTFLNVGLPVLLGSLVVAVPLAAVGYYLTLGAMNARHRVEEMKEK